MKTKMLIAALLLSIGSANAQGWGPNPPGGWMQPVQSGPAAQPTPGVTFAPPAFVPYYPPQTQPVYGGYPNPYTPVVTPTQYPQFR